MFYDLCLQVTKAHAGDYTCTPYNTHGTSGTSGIMQVMTNEKLDIIIDCDDLMTITITQVHVRDPPSIKLRPEEEYVRSVGEKVMILMITVMIMIMMMQVTFPCSASGTPTPSISWRREGGLPLPKKRHKAYQGTLTITGLQKQDHGLYECVVSAHW